MNIYRPSPTPDLDSEQTGRVWYYLTAGGCKLEPATYVYAKPDPVDGFTVYGAEDDSYIYADDTPKSWENLAARVEECLRARGWTVTDRPDGFMVARTGDGMVQSASPYLEVSAPASQTTTIGETHQWAHGPRTSPSWFPMDGRRVTEGSPGEAPYVRMLHAGVHGHEVLDYQEAARHRGEWPSFAASADAVVAAKKEPK